MSGERKQSLQHRRVIIGLHLAGLRPIALPPRAPAPSGSGPSLTGKLIFA